MINLGLIGMSDGNGHPYSWSAIFNGYDQEQMRECGFPAIPEYLSYQSWPIAKITDARVNHIWTQSKLLSEHIAKSTFIANICNQFEDLIPQVDGVLLARDDYRNHLKYSGSTLRAGLPIYIDKPIATRMIDLDLIFAQQKFDGQIFTCSALRFAKEFMIDSKELHDEIGEIRGIRGVGVKSWDKYAVHIIDPIISIMERLDINMNINLVKKNKYLDSGVHLIFKSGDIQIEFITTGLTVGSFEITLIGSKAEKKMVFSNTFNAFKAALLEFTRPIISQKFHDAYDFNSRVVKIIEAGT